MYELSARHLPYLQQTILQGCFTLFYSLRHCASLTLLSGLLSQTGMSWSQGANDLLMILQRYNSIYTQTVLAKGTDIYKRSRRASFSWLNHQIEHSYSTQPSQPARKPKPGTVVTHKSTITDNAVEQNHVIDWDSAEVVAREAQRQTR